jgi:two-component system, NarL family, nitrate/nitrite sensor histidine kinase NarX
MAKHVEIVLDDRQDFSLSIKDDGIGFDSEVLRRKGDSHVGIHIMRERAQRIHAALDVTSAPGKGTTVSLQLPHEQRRAA